MKMKNPPALILGSGGNGLGIARSLGKRGIYTIIITENNNNWDCKSRYINEALLFTGSEEELIEMLLANKDLQKNNPVLFPVRDATVNVIASRYEEIKKYYKILLPPADVIKSSLYKTGFQKIAMDNNFLVPKTFSIKNEEELAEIADNISFPCILKPELRNHEFIKNGTQKAFIPQNRKSLLDSYRLFSKTSPMVVVQEYVQGRDDDLYFCFQYYDKKSSLAASITGKKIRQWPLKCGSTCSCRVVKCPEVEKLSEQFFKTINYIGPCSMEFKKDCVTGKYYYIEPTIGRLDWNNSFAEENGIPLAYITYIDAIGRKIPKFKKKFFNRKWIRWKADYKSAMEQIHAGEIDYVKWLKSITPPIVNPFWSVKDPLPVISSYTTRIKVKIKKLLNGKQI